MGKLISIAMIALATSAGATAVMAAGDEPYKTKADECLERAKAKKFGVHFIKRDRWIRQCIKGKVPRFRADGRHRAITNVNSPHSLP